MFSIKSPGVLKAAFARSMPQVGLLMVLSCTILTCAAQATPSYGGALTVTLDSAHSSARTRVNCWTPALVAP